MLRRRLRLGIQGPDRDRTRGGGEGGHRALRRQGPTGGGELQGALHRGEGLEQKLRCRLPLQRGQVPPRRPGVHDARRRLRHAERERRGEYMGQEVQGREGRAEGTARFQGSRIDGKHREKLKRVAILHHVRPVQATRREARGVRQGGGRDERDRQGGGGRGGLRRGHGGTDRAGGHRGLRLARVMMTRPGC